MGSIYIIRNDINDKVYIGQTRQSVEDRFRQHIKAAESCGNKSKLYKAMRQLGVEHFTVDTLMECDDCDLNYNEIEAISKFNSLIAGYNSTSGGSGHTDYEPYFLYNLIQDYKSGMTQIDLCVKYNISRAYLVDLLKGVSRPACRSKSMYSLSNTAIRVIRCNNEMEWEQIYGSIEEAYNDVASNVDRQSFYREVSIACMVCNTAYGYRWQREDMVVRGDRVFRSILDLKMYEQGGKYTLQNGKIACENALDNLYGIKHRCKICNRVIDKNAVICSECYSRKQSQTIQGTNKSKPSKEVLAELMKTMSFMAIGRLFGVHGNSVKKWAIKYGLYNKLDI